MNAVCREDPDSCSCSSQNISGYLYSAAHQCNPARSLNYTLQCEVKCICRPVSEKVCWSISAVFSLDWIWLFLGFFCLRTQILHCMSAQSQIWLSSWPNVEICNYYHLVYSCLITQKCITFICTLLYYRVNLKCLIFLFHCKIWLYYIPYRVGYMRTSNFFCTYSILAYGDYIAIYGIVNIYHPALIY